MSRDEYLKELREREAADRARRERVQAERPYSAWRMGSVSRMPWGCLAALLLLGIAAVKAGVWLFKRLT